MATLSSATTKIPPLIPWPIDFIENHYNEQILTLGSLQKGFLDQSPIRFVARLPCKSPLQFKHRIARRNNGKKGESFETIVGSCISRAVAFSNRQFKTILQSFSDSSVRKNTYFGDVRYYKAGKAYSNGPIDDNGNGEGGDKGGGGGSEIGFSGGGKSGGGGGNHSVMGANWWRWQCHNKCTPSGRSVLVAVDDHWQIHQHATTWEWAIHAAITRALTEPVVVEHIQEAMLLPLQALAFLLFLPEFGDSLAQYFLAVLGAGSIVTVVLLWLLWRWWRSRRHADGEGEGDKGEDGDTE